MDATKPKTVAVVGCGQWGVKVVSCFSRIGALAAVVDADTEHAQRIADSHDVPALDWSTVLHDNSIAAIALATPPKHHARMAVEALYAGKHVYVEKPLALSSLHAKEVVAAVAETGKTLLVGHVLQYHSAFLALKSLVQQGKIGRMLLIRSTRFGPGRIRPDEDAHWCLAPHDISMILGLIGQEPISVEAHSSSFLRKEIADTVDIRLTFPDDLIAEIAVSWAHPYKERNIVVMGDQGTLVFDDGKPWKHKLRLYANKLIWKSGYPSLLEGASESIPVEQREPLLEQGRHFLECIRTGEHPITDVQEGMSVVSVLDAVTEAIRGRNQGTSSKFASSAGTESPTSTVAMVDLKAQQKRIKASLDARIAHVLREGQYIQGPEVTEFEQRLASYSGGTHVITCANGTDALSLSFLALDLHPGDAILVPAFTFVGTVEPIVLHGAIPIFVDIDPETLCIDTTLIKKGVEAAKKAGYRPVGIVAVDLFGHPSNYHDLQSTALDMNLWVIADAAQSFGASVSGQRVGSLATLTTTSFFPAKPLGCYGDGGAVFTADGKLAAKLRSLHQHGKDTHRYDHIRCGMNSRLDTLQAAILLSKLDVFPGELELRQQVAARYTNLLKGLVRLPHQKAEFSSSWAIYTIRLENRDALQEHLSNLNIMTAIHYPKPLHRQTPYQHFPTLEGGCPVAEKAATEVLSLPMHPYLEEETQQRIAEAIRSFVEKPVLSLANGHKAL